MADRGNHTIRKIDLDSHVSTVVGRAGQGRILTGAMPAGLHEPQSIAVLPQGLVIASRQAVLLARP